MSDSKQHIESSLAKSKIYVTLRTKAKAESDTTDSVVSDTIYKCVKYAYDKAKLIIKYIPEYTLHDSEHLFRVLYLMERLIPEENLENLSVPSYRTDPFVW